MAGSSSNITPTRRSPSRTRRYRLGGQAIARSSEGGRQFGSLVAANPPLAHLAEGGDSSISQERPAAAGGFDLRYIARGDEDLLLRAGFRDAHPPGIADQG